jgi:uncharacterized membrane protein YhiD involved in acid resistance
MKNRNTYLMIGVSFIVRNLQPFLKPLKSFLLTETRKQVKLTKSNEVRNLLRQKTADSNSYQETRTKLSSLKMFGYQRKLVLTLKTSKHKPFYFKLNYKINHFPLPQEESEDSQQTYHFV